VTLPLSTEGFLGGGSSSPTAPVISVVSPTPNTAPGAAGGMPASYASAAFTPIVVDVTDADGASVIAYIHVTAKFLDGSAESVYHAGAFVGGYIAESYQNGIANGYRLNILRAAGWPGASKGGNLAVGLVIDVVDTGGGVTSAEVYFEMPQATLISATPPAQTVIPTASDLGAEIRSLIIWQFRSA
jgi:hypothetical protein